MSNLYTVETTVRDVPLRIEYAVDTDEGPVLERIFIGSVRIYPVTNAQAVLHSFVHEAVAAMREDFEGVESAMQDEEANRKHDENLIQDEDPPVDSRSKDGPPTILFGFNKTRLEQPDEASPIVPGVVEKLEEIPENDLVSPHCVRGAWVKP
jgi:hypothetical protein